ncbi:hypothetical protein BDV95DRAFT_572801 [Massariosphaeria phaeospora]|uniref:Ecp2 effector protein-like domain-containing protein n=1 Tax=Massariosphaeria phaeospora TaxID=100035 RepID=A0A7C8MKV1_9PLEO|nr:hypothetical protein BDV95DRAFT_572801 [Massariosphaeria phaeospora]
MYNRFLSPPFVPTLASLLYQHVVRACAARETSLFQLIGASLPTVQNLQARKYFVHLRICLPPGHPSAPSSPRKMRLSTALAGLSVLTATAANAQHVQIDPEEISGPSDGWWDKPKTTWETYPATLGEKGDPGSYCTDPDPVTENQTSGGSPLVSDCKAMAEALPKHQIWYFPIGTGFHSVVGWGACRFGVDTTLTKPSGQFDMKAFHMTTADIGWLIYRSIYDNAHSFNGKQLAGAKGTTKCRMGYAATEFSVNWGLFKV